MCSHLYMSLLRVHQGMVGKLPGQRVYQWLAVGVHGVLQVDLFQPQ